MKVRELIERLKELPQDSEALVYCGCAFAAVEDFERVEAYRVGCPETLNYFDIVLDDEEREDNASKLIAAVVIQ